MFHCVQNSAIQRWDFYSSYADFQRSFYLNPGLGLTSTIHSYFPQCIVTQVTDCYWSEKSFLSPIGFNSRYTKYGHREELRSGPPVQYLNKRSHGQNLRSTPGQAIDYCGVFLKKFNHRIVPCTVHTIHYLSQIFSHLLR